MHIRMRICRRCTHAHMHMQIRMRVLVFSMRGLLLLPRGWGVYTCVDVRAHVYMGVSLSSQCLPMVSRRWSVAVSLAYWIVAGLRFITTLGQRPLRPELPAKTTPWGNVVALLYSFMRRRQVGLLHIYV